PVLKNVTGTTYGVADVAAPIWIRLAVTKPSSVLVRPRVFGVPDTSAPPTSILVAAWNVRSLARLAPAFTAVAITMLSAVRTTPLVPVTAALIVRALAAPVLPAVRATAPVVALTGCATVRAPFTVLTDTA